MHDKKIQELEAQVRELQKYKKEHQTSLKYQKLLELSTEDSSFTFWQYDIKSSTFFVDDLYYKFLATTVQKEGGYEISIEKYLEEFIPKESQKVLIDTIKEAYTKNSDYTVRFEYTMRRRDGIIIPVVANCYIAYDDEGKPDKGYGTKYSIVQEKKKELELINEKKKVKRLLKEQNTLISVFDKGDSVLFKWQNNKQHSVEYVSKSVSKLLGYTIEEFKSKNIGYMGLIHKDDVRNIIREIINCVKNKEDFITHKPYRLVTKNNIVKWVLQHTTIQKNEQGEIKYFISYLNNITDAKISQRKIENYLEIIDENIISSTTDLEGNITDVSTAFTKITGYTKAELIGLNHRILKDPQTPIENYKKMWKTITRNETWFGEVKNFTKENSIFWVNAKIFPLFNDNEHKTGYIAIRQDITDKKRIELLSIVDELTQLYNRRHFNTVIEDEINRARRENKLILFLMLDIDHFKQYNDTYGHQKGDEIISEISKVIKEFANRGGDSAFRLGGEEFGIIFTNTDRTKTQKYAAKLIEAVESLKIPHQKSLNSKYVTISAGLAFSNENDLNGDTLYKDADDLLYKAKANGRNRLESFKSL